MAAGFDNNAKNTLDTIVEKLKDQANAANQEVNAALDALKAGADNPALLADLQHKLNKWSVIFNISSTVSRAIKDLMQGILQKI